MKDQTLQIAKTVLSELDSFEKQFKVKEFAMPASGIGARQIKETREAQRRLLREPFVAFVKVEELREGIDDDWHEKIYLICRTYTPLGITPITPLASFANYKAPVGRVAAHEVGEELEIPVPGGKRRSIKRVYIREKNIFTPDKSQGWDAINNYFSLGDERQFIKSLRELMLSIYAETQPSQDEVVTPATPEDGALLIEKLQEMEAVFLERSLIEAQRRESRRRQVVEQIGLKDQPILDQVQDAFFRLPIDSQIILSGAPGTGKTTTLIKRLARYSVPENLSEEEKEELGSDRFELLFDPQANWVMFTPNDLLKIYLKEALNKEWLSATDDFVKIWGNERMELAREVLRFLKTGNTGSFTKTATELLPSRTNRELMAYADRFITFYADILQQRLNDTFELLRACRLPTETLTEGDAGFVTPFNDFITDCEKIHHRIGPGRESAGEDQLSVIIEYLSYFRDRFSSLRKDLDRKVESNLSIIIRNHPQIINDLLSLLPPPKSSDESLSSDERKVLAKRRLRETLVWQAERLSGKDNIGEERRYSETWGALLRRVTKEEADALNRAFLMIGPASRGLSAFEPLLKGHNQMIDALPDFYQEFRLSQFPRRKRNASYNEQEQKIREKKLSENEIDLLIFLMLRNARRAFSRNRALLYSDGREGVLRRIKARYRIQVAVDEATDFSSLQLGCMFYLAHPDINSVSLSGDLMQRVTQYGLTEWREAEYFSSGFRVQELAKSYRQSPKLLAIAARLYRNIIGSDAPFRSAYDDTREDPEPLKFHAKDDRELGQWIVDRTLEIYAINDSRLPSIAVFVPEHEDIDEVYEVIAEPLGEQSIDVEKCPQGKNLGPGSKVRIFSVDCIKGLEFEGVFFVNIDQVYERKPDLVDKYLYVGLTRAATFLGVTYKTEFPEKLGSVAGDFKEADWSVFAI